MGHTIYQREAARLPGARTITATANLVFRLIILLGLLLGMPYESHAQDAEPLSTRLFSWDRLPDLPDPIGVAGACAGISGDALIVAGGAHFPEPLFEGGAKIWTDSIYVLENVGDTHTWHRGFTLEKPLAYAVSITWDDEVVCIGGGNGEEHYADVFGLKWREGKIEQRTLPSLPEPAAFWSGALVENTIYVAGGLRSPGDSVATKNFWALDLSASDPGWEVLNPWPGPARFDPVAASLAGAFYLFSGVEPSPNGQGGLSLRFLTDAYRFQPGSGWERLADLPHAAAAAPSPTTSYGPSHLLVFGGNDGADVSRVQELKDRHPGFMRDVLAYHAITDTWVAMDTMPAAHVNTPVVNWGSDIIIPSGEIRPGTRSPAIYRATPVKPLTQFGFINYLVLGVYFLLLVGMGFYFAGREESDEDYFLARGRIPWWAAGISIFGTQLSAITFMAIPATAYATDWVYLLGQATIVLLAPVVVYLYLPFFRRLKITTAYEYLEKRFNVVVRLFGSLSFILVQLGRMGIVIFLPAIALTAATGMNIYVAILLMGLLSTLYTTLGGIEAVIWSDVVQVVVLMGGALLSLVIIALSVEGGWSGMISTAAAHNKFHLVNWSGDYTSTALWVILVGWTLSNLIPYTADQAVVQRYLTTKDEKEAARSVWTNAALTIPAALIFFGLGTALFVFYRQHAASLEPALQTDAIFPLFIVQQLPVGVAGLLIAGIFAAAMSSLDSSLNSVATAIVTDFYRRFTPDSTDKGRLRLARWLTIILGVIATILGLFMATFEIASLFDLFLELIGLFGGSLAGLFALGIFTRRAHGTGALIGAATSAVVIYLVKVYTAAHFFLYAGIGIVTCFVVGYFASILLPANQPHLRGLTIYSMGLKHQVISDQMDE